MFEIACRGNYFGVLDVSKYLPINKPRILDATSVLNESSSTGTVVGSKPVRLVPTYK